MIQVLTEGGLLDVAAQLKDGPLVISATPKTMTSTVVKCEFPNLASKYCRDFEILTINDVFIDI